MAVPLDKFQSQSFQVLFNYKFSCSRNVCLMITLAALHVDQMCHQCFLNLLYGIQNCCFIKLHFSVGCLNSLFSFQQQQIFFTAFENKDPEIHKQLKLFRIQRKIPHFTSFSSLNAAINYRFFERFTLLQNICDTEEENKTKL